MSALLDGFFEECGELLESVFEGLSALEADGGDQEAVNAVFRAVHSIKGGAGAFGLEALVAFSHVLENALDAFRSGAAQIGSKEVQLLYEAGDHLSDLVERAARGQVSGGEMPDLHRALEGICGAVDQEEDAGLDFQPLTLDILPLEPEPAAGFDIVFRPHATLFENGHEPALMLRELGELGAIDVVADLSALPTLDAGLAKTPVLGWQIGLESDCHRAQIAEVFEFAEGLCDLEIIARDAEGLKVEDPVTQSDIDRPEVVERAPARETIRVDLARVDRLINIVGELVISEAMLRQAMTEIPVAKYGPIEAAMGQFRQLSGQLQESVLAIRAQPVKGLFQRMSRIVREAAREAGKEARLVTHGSATEVDRTVVERLVDPLTHMIRNAVDHGLEDSDRRQASGKASTGTVTLSAVHRSGRVVIELQDDGGGIDRERVRQIAIDKGLVGESDELSDAEIDNLLFRPGFSTRSEVSNLSGRGVGMDVVKSEIQALGGRVSIHSEFGVGTTVTISLPLTLAVMEGMVVETAGEILVVPTTALRETFKASNAPLHALGAGGHVLNRRDGLVPVFDLGSALGFRTAPGEYGDHSLLLVETEAGRRVAFAVDRIRDQREVVIKGLQQNYQEIPGVAAATILGDGRIALIVDADQLAEPAVRGGAELYGGAGYVQ
ncbi:chemotaxis protein CheA [Shimia sp. CNT1-13L.2]|uniref:chemotaxis protein CheA n=1 Tax=Shimia sp. CNT1-13L.2 TaxID=2959663 RepID=UPI0020CE5D91|nr:chemotaxis protein CheA [Shimia sp. CNT1-13L.2]MCP9483216.1 chemotaxis protein CheA [Shimia sp. CNT1-13L.2]